MQRIRAFSRHILAHKPFRATSSMSKESKYDVKDDEIFVEVKKGIKIFVTKKGKGPPLFCMPGAIGTGQTDFPYQLDGLSDEFTVISYDPRGYGRSRPPKRLFPLDFYEIDAEDSASVMLKLGYDRYSVMGWSDGANSACILASRYPKAVEKLIIFGGNSYVTKEDCDMVNSTRDLKNWSARMLASLTPVYGDDLQPMWERYCDGFVNLLKHNKPVIKVEELEAISCPVFLLHGAKDPLVAPEHPVHFQKHLKDCSYHEFPLGKHNIHKKYANEFNKLCRQFLSEKE